MNAASRIEKVLGRPHRPGVARLVAKDWLAVQTPAASVILAEADDATMSIGGVVSDETRDEVGDEVISMGGDWTGHEPTASVFVNHQCEWFPLAIGRAKDKQGVYTVRPEPGRILGRIYYTEAIPEGKQFYLLGKEGTFSGLSIAFTPTVDPIRLKQSADQPFAGYRYSKWRAREFSQVGTQCNANSYLRPQGEGTPADLAQMHLSRGVVGGEPIGAGLKMVLKSFAAPKRAFLFTGENATKQAEKEDPVRWNKYLPTDFDVAAEPSRPSNVVWDWVSRHIGVEVKNLYEATTFAPSARMGSFLTGLKNVLQQHAIQDVRNVHGDGRESPPSYKIIPLNSRLKADYLIDGMAFYAGQQGKFVVEYRPEWGGEEVRVYCSLERRQLAADIIEKAWEWARQNNFLKGEAFTLGGEFLERTAEGWSDVILEERNLAPLKRVTDLFNKKGAAFPNRGMIFSGPPGTGKTLSNRIIKNVAKGTFIWISSRDFHRSGSFGGFAYAFDLAKELAPSVLCFEDVDNWLHDTTVDLLKTEMDGICRASGVLTILTTNFPEQMPEALIDRPGRFHDVLHFALPTADARRTMLAKWLPDVPQSERNAAVGGTDGYSGAHLYELAQFAKTLREHDGLDATAALKEAIRKVDEQRELITAVQLEGSRYRPRKNLPRPSLQTTFLPGHNRRRKLWEGRAVTKALSESNGADGGYVTKPDEESAPDKETVKASIHGVMEKHKGDAPPEGPHAAYYHPESKAVHHHHNKAAHPLHLKSVRGDLEGLPGVETVNQDDKEPVGEGWELAGPGAEGLHPAEVAETPEPADEVGQQKAMLRKAAQMSALFAAWPDKTLKALVASLKRKASPELQECVSRKIPKLIDEGFPADQAAAVAYSTCGEKKDFTDPVDGTMEDEAEAFEENGDKLPHGVGMAQKHLKHIEQEEPVMHPTDKAFWKDVASDIGDHARTNYPEHAHLFPADEAEEEEEETGEEESGDAEDKEAEEALEEYAKPPEKRHKPKMTRTKALRVRKRMAKRHLKTLEEARDHMGEMADKPKSSIFTGSEKMACQTHHKALCDMHKAMTAGGMEEEGEEMPEEKGKKLAATKDDLDKFRKEIVAGLGEALAPTLDGLFKATGDKNLHKLRTELAGNGAAK